VGHLHRLIAFDLDGTLIDSRRDLADSANQLITELGGQSLTEDAIGRMVGEGAALLVRRALEAAGVGERPDALDRYLAIYEARLLNHTRLYDGIADVIRRAREQATLTVLTNKPAGPSERILATLGIRELFDEVVGGDSTYPRKPNPDALRAMMRSAGATTKETLLVGDSEIDVATARNAGVKSCLVSYGFGFRQELRSQLSTPDVRIANDMRELARVIEDFCGPSANVRPLRATEGTR
jgi:phosphoglycolate phosphatase